MAVAGGDGLEVDDVAILVAGGTRCDHIRLGRLLLAVARSAAVSLEALVELVSMNPTGVERRAVLAGHTVDFGRRRGLSRRARAAARRGRPKPRSVEPPRRSLDAAAAGARPRRSAARLGVLLRTLKTCARGTAGALTSQPPRRPETKHFEAGAAREKRWSQRTLSVGRMGLPFDDDDDAALAAGSADSVRSYSTVAMASS